MRMLSVLPLSLILTTSCGWVKEHLPNHEEHVDREETLPDILGMYTVKFAFRALDTAAADPNAVTGEGASPLAVLKRINDCELPAAYEEQWLLEEAVNSEYLSVLLVKDLTEGSKESFLYALDTNHYRGSVHGYEIVLEFAVESGAFSNEHQHPHDVCPYAESVMGQKS